MAALASDFKKQYYISCLSQLDCPDNRRRGVRGWIHFDQPRSATATNQLPRVVGDFLDGFDLNRNLDSVGGIRARFACADIGEQSGFSQAGNDPIVEQGFFRSQIRQRTGRRHHDGIQRSQLAGKHRAGDERAREEVQPARSSKAARTSTRPPRQRVCRSNAASLTRRFIAVKDQSGCRIIKF